MRSGLVKQIMETYISRYVCGTMSDIFVEMKHEQASADAYLWGKIAELKISREELLVAFNTVSTERKTADKPVIYNEQVMAWIGVGKGA